MYKLAFIDIDGTLLTSKHTISPGTLSAIKRIKENNKIDIILTTARPPQGIEKIYDQLNLNSPVICFNGALIMDKDTNGHLFPLLTINLDKVFLNTINDTAQQHNINISFYKMTKWLTNKYDHWIKQEEDITGAKATIINTHAVIQQWISDDDGPNKILLMGDAASIDPIEPILKKVTEHKLNIYKSKPTYLEIMNGNASKKTAINFLLDKYGITYKDILAIGDNYNDIEMLELAGLGIAMGNAPEEVKAHADFITLDNDSEGIKFALDKFADYSID